MGLFAEGVGAVGGAGGDVLCTTLYAGSCEGLCLPEVGSERGDTLCTILYAGGCGG